MKDKRRFKKTLLVCVALVLVSALGGCQTPQPEVTEEVVTKIPPSWCKPLGPHYQDHFYGTDIKTLDHPYLEGYVIITWRPDSSDDDAIDKITSAVTGGMTLVENVINLDGLEIRLYSYNKDLIVLWDVVREIYQAALVAGKNVYADPVYVIGLPWDIAGSPWDIIAPGQANSLPDEGQFRSQWALAKIGLGEIGVTEDAHVVAFDASSLPPSPSSEPWSFDFADGSSLELCVSHPVPVIAPADSDDSDHGDHGTAVAGLIHAAAKQKHVHLVRVLNKNVRGDLYTLLKAMSLYLQRELDNNSSLKNVVVNLSLGLPSDLEMPQDLRGDINEALREWPNADDPDAEYLQPIQGEVPPVPALAFLVDWATDRGAVIVAAAGNDSADADSPKPAQLPARYSDVIGVAASNQGDQLSCFSNSGDVAAPGGEGDETCESMAYGLISLVSQSTSETGYTWVVGTSFAAPLVSGQVALLMNALEPSPEGTTRAEQIKNHIRDTVNVVTATGIPIINIPNSLP